MNLPEIPPADFVALLPAIILCVGAVLLLLTEVFLQAPARSYQAVVAVLSAALAGAIAASTVFEAPRSIFLGFGVQDPFSSVVTTTVCVALCLSVLSATGFLKNRHAERGEFYALMLFAGAGMSLLSLSAELITLFINLEVMSISTYALAAYLRRGTRPSEAGFKYFILGAFSSALLLYGTALLYGATGTTRVLWMAGALGGALRDAPMLTLVGLLLLAAGFAFKVAAVPFHMWAPDVYEGAPTPVTALMSAGVKAAAFAALIRVFLSFGRSADAHALALFFSALAFLSMVAGNLLAIPQRNVKRMLAYSSVAHAGYLLLGVACLFARDATAGRAFSLLWATPLPGSSTAPIQVEALKAILFYLLGYTVSVVGAFGVLGALERREEEDRGTACDLERFSGLAQRRPGWSVAMAAFMLSLGGIPPTVGFMAKLLIFRSAIDAGLLGLAVVGVLSSAAGAYYYLRVVVYMFMRPPPEEMPLPIRHWPTDLALFFSTAAVVALGVLPGTLSSWLSRGAILLGE